MSLFISYARRDVDAVMALRGDLEQANCDVWMDSKLEGGQKWWDTIIEQIRGCSVFVFALSPASIASRACRLELDYAIATDRPLLPVMLREVNVDLAADAVGTTQFVDYRERTTRNAIDLLNAVRRTEAAPLPAVLPEPPAAPVTDLGPIRDRLAAPALTFEAQQELIADAQRRIDDVDQHATLLTLLQQFRSRRDLAAGLVRDLDRLIAAIPATDDDEAAPSRRTPLAERSPEQVTLLRTLASHARSSKLMPILGFGLTDSLVGSRRHLARLWSKTFQYPLAGHLQDDLRSVAQYVTTTSDADTVRAGLADYLREQVGDRLGLDVNGGDLGTLMSTAWQTLAAQGEVHTTLARLKCPIYVNAAPWSLLSDALRAEGADPVEEICCWRPDVDSDYWPESIFKREPDYEPSAERPLVFHVFGSLRWPESLVITEDDYFDFLCAVAEHRDLVPKVVQGRMADSALMLIGFGLEDWDIRVLLRTLVNQEGALKKPLKKHLAAQVDLAGAIDPTRAQDYLKNYFKDRQPPIDIYWGSVDEVAADLAEIWAATR